MLWDGTLRKPMKNSRMLPSYVRERTSSSYSFGIVWAGSLPNQHLPQTTIDHMYVFYFLQSLGRNGWGILIRRLGQVWGLRSAEAAHAHPQGPTTPNDAPNDATLRHKISTASLDVTSKGHRIDRTKYCLDTILLSLAIIILYCADKIFTQGSC